MTYTITWMDDDGHAQTLSADSLEALSTELKALDFDRSALRVLDGHGFTAGWVSATDWRAV